MQRIFSACVKNARLISFKSVFKKHIVLWEITNKVSLNLERVEFCQLSAASPVIIEEKFSTASANKGFHVVVSLFCSSFGGTKCPGDDSWLLTVYFQVLQTTKPELVKDKGYSLSIHQFYLHSFSVLVTCQLGYGLKMGLNSFRRVEYPFSEIAWEADNLVGLNRNIPSDLTQHPVLYLQPLGHLDGWMKLLF